MDINHLNLYSIQEVLADVLVHMDDEQNTKLTPGFYRAQVKYALDELGFDISFLPVTEDFPMPEDGMLQVPKGCYNLKLIHVYNGTPENVGYVENVYWKKNAQTRGKNMGFTANQTGFNITDPFCQVRACASSLYYFTIQNGIIRLSDACTSYPYIRATFEGLKSVLLDEVKMVPPETRKAVALWVTEKCAGALKVRFKEYRQVQIDAASQLDEYGLNGAWHEAKMRLARLDTKLLKDSILYNAKLNS
jgi:hypothetical protein